MAAVQADPSAPSHYTTTSMVDSSHPRIIRLVGGEKFEPCNRETWMGGWMVLSNGPWIALLGNPRYCTHSRLRVGLGCGLGLYMAFVLMFCFYSLIIANIYVCLYAWSSKQFDFQYSRLSPSSLFMDKAQPDRFII
jgi:hypothetical protein